MRKITRNHNLINKTFVLVTVCTFLNLVSDSDERVDAAFRLNDIISYQGAQYPIAAPFDWLVGCLHSAIDWQKEQ